MRHVHLPVEHSDEDLVLAGHVAEHLESRSLYVTWSPGGYRRPVVETLWRPVTTTPVALTAVAPLASVPAGTPSHGLLGGALGSVGRFLAAALRSRAT